MKEDSKLLDNVEVQQVSGKGIDGKYNGKSYFVGNPQYIRSKNIVISPLMEKSIKKELEAAHTVTVFADKNIEVGDQLTIIGTRGANPNNQNPQFSNGIYFSHESAE